MARELITKLTSNSRASSLWVHKRLSLLWVSRLYPGFTHVSLYNLDEKREYGEYDYQIRGYVSHKSFCKYTRRMYVCMFHARAFSLRDIKLPSQCFTHFIILKSFFFSFLIFSIKVYCFLLKYKHFL